MPHGTFVSIAPSSLMRYPISRVHVRNIGFVEVRVHRPQLVLGDGVPKDPVSADRWYNMTEGNFI